MKESSSLHLKVQELCDCFATSYPLKEMSDLKSDEDKEAAALKWIALAILHGVNNNAEKVSITLDEEENVEVSALYRKAELPSPGTEVAKQIFDALNQITHIEDEKGKIPLAVGIRDSSLELKIKKKPKDGGQKITIKFPDNR